MQAQGIKNFRSIGVQKTLDFEVNHPDHLFYGNDTVISNSHSTAYGELCCISIFLKFNYPLNFYLEALKLSKQKQKPTDTIAEIARELPYFNIKLLPPDLIKSDVDFKIEGENIRYGLSAIKAVAEKSISKVHQFINKEKANLFDVFQAAQQAKLNSTVFLALIESGALDSFSENRQRTSLCWRVFTQLTAREVQYCLKNGEKYDFDIIEALKDFLNWADSSGKKIGKESRLETLRKKCEPYSRIYVENKKHPNVSEYIHEKEFLGYSQHSLKRLFEKYPYLKNVREIKEESYENDKVLLVGEIIKAVITTTRKTNKKCCRIDVADETGVVTVGFYNDKWANYIAANPAPEEGQIVYIEGKKGDGNTIWGDTLQIQALEIYLRVRDLKKLEKKESKIQEAELVEETT